MKTFLAYDIKTNRIFGYTRAASKRAATASLKRGIKGRTFGGRFGLQTMPLSDWTESELDRAGGFAIPRPADVQADMNAAFGWETETEDEMPCDACGCDVHVDDYCGNDKPDGTSEYLCPDCYVAGEA